MKTKTGLFRNKTHFNAQFSCLNNEDMLTLRGGGDPPLPPLGGDDYPIDLDVYKAASITLLSSPMLVVVKKLPTVKK